MNETALVLSIIAMLLAMAALGACAALRLRMGPQRPHWDPYRPYGPRDGRTEPFPGPFPPEPRPWDGGPRA